MGSVQSCQQQIAQELRYQSSLDLLEGTYRAIAHLPLAKEVVTKVTTASIEVASCVAVGWLPPIPQM